MLVNDTPPESIGPNVASHIALISPEVKFNELPSVSYIKECRTILRILGETLTSYRLAKAKDWAQLFTDGTSRRQVALHNLIVSVIENEEIKPPIFSSAIILEGENSEQQQEAILNMIKRCGEKFKRRT